MTEPLHPVLVALAERLSIATDYWDAGGTFRQVPEATLRRLFVALGVLDDADADVAAIDAAFRYDIECESRLALPVVRVLYELEPGSLPLRVDPDDGAARAWSIRLESGESIDEHFSLASLADWDDGQASPNDDARRLVCLSLPALPLGYHCLEIDGVGRTQLIVAPRRCYQGDESSSSARVWGLALQLYAVRSNRNWGIGDFGDLAASTRIAGSLGADVIGINPLHALFAHEPESASPYSPSSRIYLNPLNIDVEAVDEWPAVHGLFHGAEKLITLRDSELIDYSGVAALKAEAFDALWTEFVATHRGQGTERDQAFESFLASEGEALANFALFETLREAQHASGGVAGDWRQWPTALQSPDAPDARAFAESHADRIAFHAWLQWLASGQLEIAAVAASTAGLRVGLYRDLAVGIAAGGSDAWAAHSLYAKGFHVGAPPDDFSANGQDWGLPPLHPRALRQAGYVPLAAMLRANMKSAGAIRIDHVMGLARLFWIPAGETPANGTYIGYALDEMLAVLALESHRAGCLVIGEDLGTVPEGFRERLAEAGVLSYKLMYFEKHYDSDQRFRKPDEYPPQSLVGADTHDLPTLRGFWSGDDLALRRSLDLFPAPDLHDRLQQAREEDRRRLLTALAEEGLLPDGIDRDRRETWVMDTPLVAAIHRYLARSRSRLLLANIEDLLGQDEQMNLPGTDRDVYPNWRRKLTVSLESWVGHDALLANVQAMATERPR